MNEWKYWDGWKRPHTDWGSFSVDKVKCKSLSWGRGSSKPCCTVCVCVGHGLVSSILSCGPILHTVTVCILFSLSLLLCFMWGGGGGVSRKMNEVLFAHLPGRVGKDPLQGREVLSTK